MKELIILSGKGGTGKTSIVGSLAAIAQNKVMADCDVDAADLHLLLSPLVKETNDFLSGQVAVIDNTKCIECGLCQRLCRFDAIHNNTVDSISCEGCGFCSHICPVGAITMKECRAGEWYISDTKYGPLVHARLGIGEENSGKLVALVRKKARETAKQREFDLIISDGPPGIGCPVISSLSGASMAVIITEPTISGIHDMKRVIEVCQHFDIPVIVCINKYDLNPENTGAIYGYCRENNIDVAAMIPFDNTVTEAMVKGLSVAEYSPGGRVTSEIKALWWYIEQKLQE